MNVLPMLAHLILTAVLWGNFIILILLRRKLKTKWATLSKVLMSLYLFTIHIAASSSYYFHLPTGYPHQVSTDIPNATHSKWAYQKVWRNHGTLWSFLSFPFWQLFVTLLKNNFYLKILKIRDIYTNYRDSGKYGEI